MALRFRDYKQAREWAQGKANLYGRSYGIRKVEEFGEIGYNVRPIPNDPAKRFAADYTCETVEPMLRGTR